MPIQGVEMTSKRINKRFGVKRLRRALNSAECPPPHAGMSLTRSNWGAGPRRNTGLDASHDLYDEYDAATMEQDWVEFWGYRTLEDMQRAANDETDWQRYAQCAA